MTDETRLVCAESIDLTGFSTEADADLRALRLRALDGQCDGGESPGRAAPIDVERGLLQRAWDRLTAPACRIWNDLTAPTEPTRDGPAQAGCLNASHARIGGTLTLPGQLRTLRAVDLTFLRARALEVYGDAFRCDIPLEVVLDASNASIDSFDLREPLPQRANLQNCRALSWQVSGNAGLAAGSRDEERRYIEMLDRSWPFAQDVYARLERDYRDLGEQRMADRLLKRLGWRLWRWSYLRQSFQRDARSAGRGWLLGVCLAGLAALVAWGAMRGDLRGLEAIGAGVVVTCAVWLAVGRTAPLEALTNAARFVVGLVLLPLHLVYGFGVRWWVPLFASGAMLLFVTWPMLEDCRNLATATEAARRTTTQAGSSCEFRLDGQASTWTSSNAFWAAVQYHVPIVSTQSYYQGEVTERVRPVGQGAPYLAGSRVDEQGWYRVLRWVPGVEWLFGSPERYTRFIFLTSWIIVPFSLVFFAGRMQRKYRLQQG